jgi:hypothetical protein
MANYDQLWPKINVRTANQCEKMGDYADFKTAGAAPRSRPASRKSLISMIIPDNSAFLGRAVAGYRTLQHFKCSPKAEGVPRGWSSLRKPLISKLISDNSASEFWSLEFARGADYSFGQSRKL